MYPVVLFIFNRPETTQQVFAEIRRARPQRLLVVADGPRPNQAEDVEKCALARAVVSHVDWPCDMLTHYSDINLGCQQRLASGLDWVFSQVEAAIILEDDCLPHPAFFGFCDELLDHYYEDERIMHIGGANFQHGRRRNRYSYYFSRYMHVWGWASWRRAWHYYDVTMPLWRELRNGEWLWDLLGDPILVAHWKRNFDRIARQELDTWDYQWVFACWAQGGLSIIPRVNLVRNIGFDGSGTHTRIRNPWADLQTFSMEFPLKHPPFVLRDRRADRFTDGSELSLSRFLAWAANLVARGLRRS